MTVRFDDLGLSSDTLRAVTEAGYETPTPIQEKAIPYVLMNRDVLGCAQTGTGKTASFTLPMIDILSEGRARARMPRSIILAPTRELAAQVAENFETYGKYHKLTMALLIGGVSFGEQEKIIDRGADVLIATPGRLLDHAENGKVILTDTKIVVIDEADRMLDMGFIPDVERILGMTPPLHQTVMFSATMPKEIRKLAERFLHNPKEISVSKPSSTAENIEQGVAQVNPRAKRSVLRKWLADDTVQNALVFCNRKRDVASLHKALESEGLAVGALHGDMDQYKRMECLEHFRNDQVKILICSDVAARGLDIPSVSHVFNYDVPTHAEDYVHRIGRTGRAGRSGVAYTIATGHDDKHLKSIEKLIGKKLPTLEGFDDKVEEKQEKPATTDTSDKQNTPDKQKRPDRSSKGRSNKRGRRRDGHDIGEVEDTNLPFGQTDGVPAFLLRTARK